MFKRAANKVRPCKGHKKTPLIFDGCSGRNILYYQFHCPVCWVRIWSYFRAEADMTEVRAFIHKPAPEKREYKPCDRK